MEHTPEDRNQMVLAVAQHAVSYSLPTPLVIYPHATAADDMVEVAVAAEDLFAWMEPMLVDEELEVSACTLAGMERIGFRGRLITAGHGTVHIELRSTRPTQRVLSSVTA